MLLDEKMRNTMIEEQRNEAASAAGEGHSMSQVGLPAGKIYGHVHDAVSNLVTVICEMKYVHRNARIPGTTI
jgi:hypothetical protein